MAETRKSTSGTAAKSGWVGATPSNVFSGGTPTATTLATTGTAGTASLANTIGSFGQTNRGLIAPGVASRVAGPTGYSPYTSRVSSGWTAGKLAPASGPGQNFGVGTLNDPRLGARVNVGQPANTGQVISGSTYRSGAGLPGFVAGAVNDLNSGASGRAAMQAEWLSRLANQMGASGDNAYLWAEVLRGAGGINSGPGNTTTGGGGGISFGQSITPGAIARGQGNLLDAQANAAATRAWIAQNAVARQSMNWDLQKEIANTQSLMSGSPIGTQPYASQLANQQAAWQNNMNTAQQMTNTVAALSPNQRNLMNQVAGPGQSFSQTGPIAYNPIPYVALPY